MNIKRISIITVLIACSAFPAFGQGTFEYDQQSTTGGVYEGGADIPSSQPIGQSFTPSLNAVGFVQLFLIGENSGNNANAVVYVDLLSGSITGTVIGQSATQTVPIGAETAYNFIFTTPVSLTPGTTYYIQPEVQSGDAAVSASTFYQYSSGSFYVDGAAVSDGTMYFREGIIVPEPSTWALLVASAGGALLFRKRTRVGQK